MGEVVSPHVAKRLDIAEDIREAATLPAWLFTRDRGDGVFHRLLARCPDRA